MIIEYGPEAGKSFDNALSRMGGYCLQVTTEDEGTEPFDVLLVGLDHDAGWHGTILVRAWDDALGHGTGPVFSVAVNKVVVY